MSENKLPRVTIVASSLNSARYLPEMIESVLVQDYPNLELFIQDGGSQDGTLELLQHYPIRWASEPDKGISQALNRAIQAAHGEIIGFTSSDDKLQAGAVAIAVETFQAYPKTVLVYGDCYLSNESGRPYKLWKSRPFDLDQLFWGDYIPFQTTYVRRQALLDVGGFDETMRAGQDIDLWVRLGGLYPAESFQYVSKVLGNYRYRFNSFGGKNFHETALSNEKTSESFFNNPLTVTKLKKGKNRALAGANLTSAFFLALSNNKKSAWKYIIRALRLYPALVFTKGGLSTILYTIAGPQLWRSYKMLQQRRKIENRELIVATDQSGRYFDIELPVVDCHLSDPVIKQGINGKGDR